MSGMRVSIGPDLEKLVRESVERGCYESPSELVREALLLLLNEDPASRARVRRLRKEVERGLREVEQGRIREFEPDLVKRQARRRLSSSREA